MSKKYVQALTQYLAGNGVLIGATSATFVSLVDIYGNAITNISAFGDKAYVTFEPDTINEEAGTATSITVNANGTVTLGGLSTVLAQSPYTETSGLVRAHSGGTKVVITDNVAFWNTFGNKNNDEALVGRWTTPVAPLNPNDLVNKTYADGLAIAGAPDSSTTVKGIGRVSTAPVSPTIPIFVGDNDPRVPTQNENDALVGTSGTPVSSANKLVDAADVSNAGASAKIVRLNGTAYPAGDGSALTNLSMVPKMVMSNDMISNSRFTPDANNGTNTFGATGLSQTTTGTSGSYALEGYVFPTGAAVFAAGGNFSAMFTLTAIGTTGTSYIGIGNPAVTTSGVTLTDAHIGFKVVIAASVATLSATVADGTETATSLGTIAVNDVIEVMCQIISTSLVNFYWRKNGGALSAAVPITTHIPTAANVALRIGISNNNTATTNTQLIDSINFQR